MLDFDAYEIIAPMRPIGISLVLSPEEVEFALSTNGRSLHAKLVAALIAHLIVELDTEAVGTVPTRVAAAAG